MELCERAAESVIKNRTKGLLKIMDIKKVMVGMSGGVDSSVTALLLKQQGYDVTGVTLKLRPEKYVGADDSQDDINDAKRVADKIGITHDVVDLSAQFEKRVIENFAISYCSGYTPNPCVLCNKFIKFGAMFDYALENGFDYIATGHYANVEYNKDRGRWLLRRANSSKDQSYVLYNLTQNQLAHTLFPLGNFEKDQTRKIAGDFGLPIAKKPDSQEICFIKSGNYIDFLKKNFNVEKREGNFLDKSGNVLGRHKGILNYTVGQRKGLGVTFGEPMYVTGINTADNTVILGKDGEQYSTGLTATDLNFIPFDFPSSEIAVTAKIRYQANPENARVVPLALNKVNVIFDRPQRAVTKGQSVVFYDENIVIGGGVIS